MFKSLFEKQKKEFRANKWFWNILDNFFWKNFYVPGFIGFQTMLIIDQKSILYIKNLDSLAFDFLFRSCDSHTVSCTLVWMCSQKFKYWTDSWGGAYPACTFGLASGYLSSLMIWKSHLMEHSADYDCYYCILKSLQWLFAMKLTTK